MDCSLSDGGASICYFYRLLWWTHVKIVLFAETLAFASSLELLQTPTKVKNKKEGPIFSFPSSSFFLFSLSSKQQTHITSCFEPSSALLLPSLSPLKRPPPSAPSALALYWNVSKEWNNERVLHVWIDSRCLLFIEAQTGDKTYEHILTETRGKVGLITLNRPKALNALCGDLFIEVNEALRNYDNNDNVGAVVITGSEKAFAGKWYATFWVSRCIHCFALSLFWIAGADIKEMKDKAFIETYKTNFLGHWAEMTEIKKPILAAVNGYAVSSIDRKKTLVAALTNR